jgi:hypothetical protein
LLLPQLSPGKQDERQGDVDKYLNLKIWRYWGQHGNYPAGWYEAYVTDYDAAKDKANSIGALYLFLRLTLLLSMESPCTPALRHELLGDIALNAAHDHV